MLKHIRTSSFFALCIALELLLLLSVILVIHVGAVELTPHWVFQILTNHMTGQEIFPQEIYLFDELPARIIMTDLLWIGVISVLLCTFGGVIPALRAAKLDPSKALRYE